MSHIPWHDMHNRHRTDMVLKSTADNVVCACTTELLCPGHCCKRCTVTDSDHPTMVHSACYNVFAVESRTLQQNA